MVAFDAASKRSCSWSPRTLSSRFWAWRSKTCWQTPPRGGSRGDGIVMVSIDNERLGAMKRRSLAFAKHGSGGIRGSYAHSRLRASHHSRGVPVPQVVGGFARPGLGGSRGFPKSLATWRTMTGAHRVIRGAEQSQRNVAAKQSASPRLLRCRLKTS